MGRAEVRGLGVKREGLLNSPFDGRHIGVLEDDAGTLAGRRVPVPHRIGQSAGGSYDREGAVGHRVHLVEAAGFEAARHQEEVAPGFDTVGKRVVVADAHADAARKVIGEPAVLLFEPTVAATQQHELQSSRPEELRERLDGEVQALLVPEARNHADQRGVGSIGQLELFLQVNLAGTFAGEVLGAEVFRQMLVLLRVPFVEVDAVQDAVETGLAALHDVLQAETKGGREDFLRVGRADGDDAGRVEDAALEEVHATEAFELLGFEEPLREPQERKDAPAQQALMLEVVDR